MKSENIIRLEKEKENEVKELKDKVLVTMNFFINMLEEFEIDLVYSNGKKFKFKDRNNNIVVAEKEQ